MHFLIIGAVLFLGFASFQTPEDAADNTITISQDDINVLKANFTRTWQRQPTPGELDGLVEEKIREEIAYREALAMRLDLDDAYIRRRLRMKLELMLEDIVENMVPTEEELTEFLEQHPELFRQEEQISFSHVYLNGDNHRNSLDHDADQLLTQLNKAGADIDPEQFGDATMLPRTYPLSPLSVIGRQLGDMFTRKLSGMETGKWQGPLPSSYGYHLVLVHESIEGRAPELSEIRPIVEREFNARRRKEVKDTTYTKLRARYQIIVEQSSNS
ncbi:peptidyl-prolyl cis-trans isomerase [Desulfopila sp. IMCC35008]|uniref:peptidylprolyl isomerase n=1 Tax=Desulfopila sp. IMCC35008 TaxID=2653858 RepID=UPI0013D3A5A5|nr:peptidylprolyl isomerase [Desulfopila sp. IMCC35008]